MVDRDEREPGVQGQQEPRTFWVRSTEKSKEDGGNTVVLWETDPAHPKGEVLIAGHKPVEVGMTPRVSQLLRDGKLVKTAAPRPEPKVAGKQLDAGK